MWLYTLMYCVIIFLGTFDSWVVAKFLLKEGGDIMFKKDLLIFSLIILIFLLVLLLFIVLIWKENHLTQLWIRWTKKHLATLNTAILNVPLIFYEVSFICIHGNIKTTYFQVVLYLILKDQVLIKFGAGNRTWTCTE